MPTICLASDYLEKSFFFDMWLKATVFSGSFTGVKIKGRYHSKTHGPKARTGSATVTTGLSARKTLLQWCKLSTSFSWHQVFIQIVEKKHLSHTGTARHIKASVTAILKHYVQLMKAWENTVLRFLLSLLSFTGWICFFSFYDTVNKVFLFQSHI